MQSIRHVITLKTMLAIAAIAIICNHFMPSPLSSQPVDTGNYYDYGPFRAYYDSAQN